MLTPALFPGSYSASHHLQHKKVRVLQGCRSRSGRSGGRRTNLSTPSLRVAQNVCVAEAHDNDYSHTHMFTTQRVTAVVHTCACNMAESQFQLTKMFNFPKQQFGTMGKEKIFQAEWCDMFSWLHYDVKTDSATRCMHCEAEKKFLARSQRLSPKVLHTQKLALRRSRNIKEVIVTMRVKWSH